MLSQCGVRHAEVNLSDLSLFENILIYSHRNLPRRPGALPHPSSTMGTALTWSLWGQASWGQCMGFEAILYMCVLIISHRNLPRRPGARPRPSSNMETALTLSSWGQVSWGQPWQRHWPVTVAGSRSLSVTCDNPTVSWESCSSREDEGH